VDAHAGKMAAKSTRDMFRKKLEIGRALDGHA